MWFPGVDPKEKRWLSVNQIVLAWLAALLLAAGIAGFVVPDGMALMSGAPPYNVFHLGAAACGLAILRTRRPGPIAGFNLGFGLVDLWQLLAGVSGLFPAAWFALRPADHLAHGVIGAVLVFVGARGLGAIMAAMRAPAASTTGSHGG